MLCISFRPSITSTLAFIHEFVLKDCHQIPWAGENVLNSYSVEQQRQKELKDLDKEVDHYENYSKCLLMERIALAHRCLDTAQPNEIFVGPTTYDRFLHCFKNLLEKKEKAIKDRVKELR